MNEAIVERWNARVRKKEEIFFLGDFGFGKEVATTFQRLNGRKHLIVGNHDLKQGKAVLNAGWDSVEQIKVFKDNGRRVVLCHYPIESWPSAHKGALHFHGHSHGSLKRRIPGRLDVGFEPYSNGPVALENAIKDAQEMGPNVPQDGGRED